MGDDVKITLGADVSGAVAGIEKVTKSGEKLRATVGTVMKAALGELAGAAGQAGVAMQDLSAAFGLSAGAATAAIAIGAALKFSIEFYTETLNIATQGMKDLGDQTYKTGENLKKLIQESKKAGLIDDNEALGFLKNIATGKAMSGDPDRAARAINAVTRELRLMLEARREIAAFQKAQDKANLSTVQGDSLFGNARAGLANAEIGAANLSPEEEAQKRIAVAGEVHKRKIREFEQEEIIANRLKEAAIISDDKLALIEIESNLSMHSKKVEASWLDLAAKEVEIRKNASDKRKQIDADAETARVQKLQEEEELLSRIYEIERARIAGDFRLSDVDKRRLTIDNLKAEGNAIPGAQSKRSKQQLGFLEAEADPNSTRDQTIKAIVDIKNSMGTAAQNISQVFVAPIQGAFVGLQGSISGLIKGTMTWKDAMANVASSIVEQLVSAIAMLIAKAIILATVIAALNFIAPGLGSALGSAAGIGAREQGGVAGPGLYQVGERGPEYVVNNPTLNRMGTSYFDSLQAGYTPPQAAPQGGGQAVHIGFIGGPSMVGQWLESREGRAYVADIADQRIREARG